MCNKEYTVRLLKWQRYLQKRSSMFDASSKVNFMYSTFIQKWV